MVSTPQRVIFYQLSAKFLEQARVADQPKQLIHYTLAIGHHIGVIDCFAAKLDLPYEHYAPWIAHLPEGEARRKLEGLLRFGEIEIAAPHAPSLQAALRMGRSNSMSAEERDWTNALSQLLQEIEAEPALYLMVRTS